VKTFVTGGTGFVGAAVVRQLLAKGHEVRALARPNGDRRNLDSLDVEIIEGSLADRSALARGLIGTDNVFHIAADYRLWVADPAVLYTANVAGTHNLLLEAADAGTGRIVYTSSVATLGINADGTPGDESTTVSIDDMIGHYKRSKFLAEELVWQFINGSKLPITIVNPSTPIGPRDIKPTPTGRMIRDAALGKMPAYVDTGLNLVHVDDVARGHLLAMEHGKIGERYILGGHDLSLKAILHKIAAITGRRPPLVKLPRAAIFPIAYLSEAWARATSGPEPQATVDGLKMSRKRMYFSSAKAVRDLRYSYRSVDEALADAVSWFLSE
jgi:dihydroflavonol-4-reductase